jgi:hypothetical protein
MSRIKRQGQRLPFRSRVGVVCPVRRGGHEAEALEVYAQGTRFSAYS